jgi:Ca2+:H+ antiporter
VASLRQFSARSGLSQAFLGLIILPVASNATDHMTSVLMACRGKMDLAFGCSLGSALQVAALMLPVLVLVGWGAGRPFTMELDLSLMLTLSFAAVLVAVLTKDGRSDYLQGALLLVLYCAVAVCYGLLPAASFHAM